MHLSQSDHILPFLSGYGPEFSKEVERVDVNTVPFEEPRGNSEARSPFRDRSQAPITNRQQTRTGHILWPILVSESKQFLDVTTNLLKINHSNTVC